MKKLNEIKYKMSQYYSEKIQLYGANYKGVDWNSEESQIIRFKELLKICDRTSGFTINDLGCGYGAMFKYMMQKEYYFNYSGYDLSGEMIHKGKELFSGNKNCIFINDDKLKEADYTIASGIFNVKLDTTEDEWQEYIIDIINNMNIASIKGFSFNMLTVYSDKEYMRDYLFYGDPCFFFDYCKRNFSKAIALLHDYGLYEFTILVRKD